MNTQRDRIRKMLADIEAKERANAKPLQMDLISELYEKATEKTEYDGDRIDLFAQLIVDECLEACQGQSSAKDAFYAIKKRFRDSSVKQYKDTQ